MSLFSPAQILIAFKDFFSLKTWLMKFICSHSLELLKGYYTKIRNSFWVSTMCVCDHRILLVFTLSYWLASSDGLNACWEEYPLQFRKLIVLPSCFLFLCGSLEFLNSRRTINLKLNFVCTSVFRVAVESVLRKEEVCVCACIKKEDVKLIVIG